MLTATLIAEAMAGQDATNGWDAAYGMNLKQVNALFLQHYLQNGPAHTSVRLRVAMESQPVFWMLEADLGPPKLEFQRERQVATMDMELVRAVLIEFDPEREVIHSVSRVRPVESRLTGPLELAHTAGEVNQVGRVVADLGATAYTPSISGVDPKSALQTKIADAVKTYFGATNTVYPLGTIAMGNTPDCLRPTGFHFWVQQKPGSDDACVLLLVRTNGKDGVVGPLAAYPIPDNHTAALIINKAVVGQLLLDRLTSGFSGLGWRFAYQQKGMSWKVACVGGDLDFGVFGREERVDGAMWSADSNLREAPVRIPTSGFTVEPSGGSMSARWAPNHEQDWGYYHEWTDWQQQTSGDTYLLHSVISPFFSQSGPPTVNPVTAVVTFGGSPRFTVNHEPSDHGLWDRIVKQQINVPGPILDNLRQEVEPSFRDFRLPKIEAFALTSLLFPAQHAVTFHEAKLPGDLYLAGALAPTLPVTPVDSAVTPGQTVRFQVAGLTPEEVLWKLDPIDPKFGKVDEHGVYTAPRTVKDPAAVVVSAVSRKNASLKGAAMLLLYTPATKTGVAISPDLATVTAGQQVELTATDDGGNFMAVNWTQPDFGQIKRGRSHGKYVYTAPDSISSPREVRAEASDLRYAARKFTAVISLRPSAKVKVSPSGSKVKLGGTLEMTAETSLDEETIHWSVFPIGAGSISVHSDRKSATYRAPAKAPDNDVDVTVFAYSIDDVSEVGIGAAELTLVL